MDAHASLPGDASASHESTSSEVERFSPPRGRLLLHALGCLAVAAVAVLPAVSWLPVLAWSARLVVVGLVAAAAVLTARAVRPGPSVLVGRDGLTDRTTLAPAVLLRWDEITVIRKKEVGRGRGAEHLLEVVLADPAGYRARQRGPRRRAVEWFRRALRLSEVSIPQSMVSVPLHHVAAAVQRWRPDLEILEGPPPPPPKWRLGARRTSSHRYPDLPRW